MGWLEPLGLLQGRAARDAIAAGLALPLAGGPTAFSLVRRADGAIQPVAALADDEDALQNLTTAPGQWAGFPPGAPLVMGIVNVTPDSFSDGGRHFDHAAAIAAARRMRDAGADILDIGGESTRPGALETPPQIEQDRILPVVAALAAEGAVISVDTRHASTAREAMRCGAGIINDVSGFTFDPALAGVARDTGASVVAMHMRGVPETMQRLATYADVVRQVAAELGAALQTLALPRASVAVDPGIGFAKGPGHNEELLARLPLLLNLGCRVVVGVSRKGFIGRIGGEADPQARFPGSLAAALAGVLGGASILRVHDVAATVQGLRVWQAINHAA